MSLDNQENEPDPDTTSGEEPEGSEARIYRYFLVLFLANQSLDRGLVLLLQETLKQFIHTPKQHTRIDIWLDSPGGDAHAAYKLVLEIRSRAKEYNVVIPDLAKSAATLVSLGSRHIYMGSSSELGPLDTQIPHPDRENVTVSALNVANSLTDLGLQTISLALVGGKKILDSTDLTRLEVLRATLHFVARYTRPAISRLDPTLIHLANNQLNVALHYAAILLQTREVPDEEAIGDSSIAKTCKLLVNAYPDHGYVISRHEAKKRLGLPIRNLEDYDYLDELYGFYNDYIGEAKAFIAIIEEEEFLQQGDSDGGSSDGNGIEQEKQDEDNGDTEVHHGEDPDRLRDASVAGSNDSEDEVHHADLQAERPEDPQPEIS